MPNSDLEARHIAAFNCRWCISMRGGHHSEGHFCHLKRTPHHRDLAPLLLKASVHCLLPALCRAFSDLSPQGPAPCLPTLVFIPMFIGFYIYGQPLPPTSSTGA